MGLFALNYGTCADPEAAIEVARHGEDAGLESVWSGEHVVLPDPAPDERSFPPTLPFLDSMVALTWIAAHTRTLKVASGIIVLPLRNPVLLAKQLASIDRVSGGRSMVGVAGGYARPEFTAVGVPYSDRHRRTDDYISALRALWSMDHPHHRGAFASSGGINAHPRPLQVPGPPLIVGGESRPALLRAVTMANGWYGLDLDAVPYLDTLQQLAIQYERPSYLGQLEITITPTGPLDRDTVERYEELGVDRLVLLPQPDVDSTHKHRPVPRDRIKRAIDWIADDLMDH